MKRKPLKNSWNPAGVEIVHLKLAHIDPGLRVSGTDQKCTVVQSQWYKSKKRGQLELKSRIQEGSWADWSFKET